MSALATRVKGIRNAAVGSTPPVALVPNANPGQNGRVLNFGGANSKGTQLDSYSASGTLYACVSLLANSTSQVDWKLYRTSTTGNDADRTPVLKHPALTVWNNPNQFMTQNVLIEIMTQHLDLTGEAWCVFEYHPIINWPTGIWPVRPDRMNVVTSETQFIAGYTYSDPDGDKIPLTTKQVGTLMYPDPKDPTRGIGPVEPCMPDIAGGTYAALFNRNFFVNDASPGGVISFDHHLSDEEFDDFTKRWTETHKGVNKAHKIALIENATYTPSSITQRDMQFTQLRQVSDDQVMRAFRIPRSVLGEVQNVNKANAQTGELTFAKWCLIPRLEKWKKLLNSVFLPLFGSMGQGVEFDYVDPVPADADSDSAALTASSQAALWLNQAGYDPQDILQAVNLPAMKTAPKPKPAPVVAPPAAEPAIDPKSTPPDDAPEAVPGE